MRYMLNIKSINGTTYVESSSNIVEISLPNINYASTIKRVKIRYVGKNPENVKLSYKGTKGKIDLIEFVMLNDKSKSVNHLLPPINKLCS